MDLRIFTEPQQGASYDMLLAVAKATEELGFDAFFRSDHYLVMGDGDGLPGPTDAWITLAGLARDTSRIRLGTLMTAGTFRLPGVLAIQVAQVDQMSGGRIEFGLGAGWYEAEHTAYGIPFPKEKFGRLEEQLAVVTGLWGTPVGQTFDFDGEFYQLKDSPALPKPAQPEIPVLIGGMGAKRTPELAAKYAAEFNVPFVLGRGQRQAVRPGARGGAGGRARRGRPGVLQRPGAGVGKDDAEVARRAAAIGRDVEELKAAGLAGTPAEVVDKIGRYADQGSTRFYLQILDLKDLDHLELISSAGPVPGGLTGATGMTRPMTPPVPPLGELLGGGKALVLDGGLSNQLADQGCDLSDPLWSARLLADGPEQIAAAHTAYVRAGAQVLITASYQATYEGFARRGVGRRAGVRAAAAQRRTGPAGGGGAARRCGWRRRSGRTGRCSRTAVSTGGGTAGACGSWSGSTGRGSRRWPRPGRTCWRWRRCRTATRRRRCCGRPRARASRCGCRTPIEGDRTRAGQPLRKRSRWPRAGTR